jgi:O-succinylbenzoate synthase
MPLARLIGGTRDEIAVGISLGIQQSPDALVARARAALAEGYRKIKIKIKPGADVPYVQAVRTALGPDTPLMADANNAYTLDDAAALMALDALGLMMIEQPLAWDDLVRHADLQKQLRTPLCLDESITSLDRAQDMVRLGSGRIVNIKPGRVGGFTSSIAIHDYCEQNAIPVWCGGMLESGIGRAYNVALASLPNFVKPGDVSPSSRYWQRDVVTPEWTMTNGMMRVPLDRPGIGVEVDRDRIDDLTVREEVLGDR